MKQPPCSPTSSPRVSPDNDNNMKRPASYSTTSSRNKKRKLLTSNSSRHHPTCGTRFRLRPAPRPSRSLVTPDYVRTLELQAVAESSRRLISLKPPPQDTELRHSVCTQLMENMLMTVWWHALGFVGSRLWLVEPRRCGTDFAEEAAFVLSLAQEFIAEEENEFEDVAPCAEESRVVEAGKLVGLNRALRMDVNKEFRITDEEDRVAFVGVLAGLAQVANVVRAGEEVDIEAASWSW
ncbi:hypothetical protein BDD12DRAFT_874033 [Trichophaea hybrida]|nr:hypothetical protein BDD12DRAFT_874033 [Trichophaea hybrida]